MDTFRCLKLAYMAAEAGGVNTAIYSIADDIAVEQFLNGNIKFTEIEVLIEKALNDFSYLNYKSAADILHINVMVREKLLNKYCGQ